MSHPVVHFEVIGKDHAKLTAFYGDVFGWKLKAMEGMPYSLIEKEGEGIGGGIGAAPDGSAGHVTFYVSSMDPQATVDKAVAAGGSVAMPMTDLGMVKVGLIADPEGHVVGIVDGRE
ncbi:MAG: VOC family protein [Gaiellales bacterium]